MTTKKIIFKTNLGLSLLLLTALLCTACGTTIIKGASPMVRMTELSHKDSNIGLQVSMRNVNGVDLNIKSIEFSLTVNQNED
jgi:hypothetical protein